MNLLTDPIFRVETSDEMESMSLPQLLEALGQDRVESLHGLQRHQEDSFHIFLCYLAGAVLARERQSDPRQQTGFWLEGIRSLTGREDDLAWTLVVEDVTQPAFMQAPLPKKEDFAAFKPKAPTPDALDVLPTAKNHDVKTSKSGSCDLETWTYALISLQTMAGFFGKGNYGIARMNGGFASRPMVSLRYSRKAGGRWRRDVGKLLAQREALLGGPWGYKAEGLAFTWLQAWDLQSSLGLQSLDPFFIEISRAVRLLKPQEGILALGVPTSASRINAKNDKGEQNGVLGDPWTPINCADKKKGESALTVSATGLHPELLHNLIFEKGGYKVAPMQLHDAEKEAVPCLFYASVLVRGQGTTDGFHQVELQIPAKAMRKVFSKGLERDRLAELSSTGLTDAKVMQNNVLKPAILGLLEGGPEQLNFDKREVSAWLADAVRQFSESWSVDFFPWLWRMAEQEKDKDAARLEWLVALRDKAKAVLDDSIDRYPAREGRRYRSIVKAQGIFFGCLYNKFQQFKELHHESIGSEYSIGSAG